MGTWLPVPNKTKTKSEIRLEGEGGMEDAEAQRNDICATASS